jgi:hypothetical protein
MTDWVDGPATLANADDALHSGITGALLRGNLHKAQEQSRFGLMAALPTAVSHDTGDLWEWFDAWHPFYVNSRTILGGGNTRQIKVVVDGRLEVGGAAQNAYIRIHFINRWSGTPIPAPADGLVSFPYATVGFSTSSYVMVSTDIRPDLGSDDFLLGLSVVTNQATNTLVYVRSLYLRESAT